MLLGQSCPGRVANAAPRAQLPRPLVSARPLRLCGGRLQPLRASAPIEEAAPHSPLEALVQAAEPARKLSAFELKRIELKKQRAKDAMTYRASAIAASFGFVSLAVLATYLRFEWHLEDSGEFPWDEMVATLALTLGGMFGMEMYARFAHKVLWHDFEPGWALHKSHHQPRTGPFELNDIYAVANALPAIALCAYGFLTPNVTGGLCFGAGLGITLFGISYMFFHDGVVHKRFPVGPIAEHPYMKRIVVAHQIHHTDKFQGVPFGMFLGPQELEAVPGGREELDRMVAAMEERQAAARSAP